jgi:phospholipid/cholesterol/gamma-HCH transport system substrate-binding protein
MKKESGNTIKLGVFVTLGILLFIVGIYFVGQKQRMFSSVFSVSGIFKNVNGLQVGNNVRFAGINIGTVSDITILNDTSVKVELIIDESVHQFIKKDARALIGSEGLMGNKTVNIVHGSAGEKKIEEDGLLVTASGMNTDEIIEKLKITADNAAAISANLERITDNISNGKGTIGKLFMDTAMASTLNQTIINLKTGTKGFKENMDAAKHSFFLRRALKKSKKDDK